MSELVGTMQDQLKRNSGEVALFFVKFISGAILGLTFGLIMQEILGKAEGENVLGFFFMIIATSAAFMKVAKSWRWAAVLIFDLICVLVGLVLRLYILIAPNV